MYFVWPRFSTWVVRKWKIQYTILARKVSENELELAFICKLKTKKKKSPHYLQYLDLIIINSKTLLKEISTFLSPVHLLVQKDLAPML